MKQKEGERSQSKQYLLLFPLNHLHAKDQPMWNCQQHLSSLHALEFQKLDLHQISWIDNQKHHLLDRRDSSPQFPDTNNNNRYY